jgi:23S rRNA (pseudouridine1915-N3)-methyltransferase
LKAIPGDCYTVLLDERGKKLSTMKLSVQLKDWLDNDRDVCFIIGGPDGVDKSLSDAVDVKWSLSDFTLPHALIRVILAEQLYRAWSILNNHPYHRQ